ncbi:MULTISPECIES: hypothetical protein [unclassified Prochlorococcus]|uniref:hypothetical protein n=1 Tax=unclassified Prochlorococcus TaxID=2627481 RepID=UPI0005338B46|nr:MULTISPECIES: hypothetical protein [unclassified Prochlorococcus]KGG23762.1 hypothetical protein EV12_3110 [Prochlorococcus sp. MIT 0701]KGG30063.1 hypothetical protein EV14_2996 [Prochlorococcus sp. MIT 0703]KGG30662.1 hypothetical protein EV13_0099 [Prochlorococcus sp. MIT 0702]
MASLEQFRQLHEISPEELSALGSQYILDTEAATAKIIQMAADKGFEITPEEITRFISQMSENDEFNDIQLSSEALAAVAGGASGADWGMAGYKTALAVSGNLI